MLMRDGLSRNRECLWGLLSSAWFFLFLPNAGKGKQDRGLYSEKKEDDEANSYALQSMALLYIYMDRHEYTYNIGDACG